MSDPITTATANDLSSSVDPDLIATFRDLATAHGPSVRDPESGLDLDLALWSRLEELGLARLTGAEADGGSGATWQESAALLTQLALAGVAAPVGEHDLLAGWLLRRCGVSADARLRTVAVLGAGATEDSDGPDHADHAERADRPDRIARAVPWARDAHSVACLWQERAGWRIADVPADRLRITPGLNLAGEPRDEVTADLASLGDLALPEILSEATLRELDLRAALLRAVQLAAALESCLSLTLDHVSTRVQFGRAISRFQAVQHTLAQVAAETALARAATDAAVRVATRRDAGTTGLDDLAFAVAVARSCAGHAASLVVRRAHQMHGAIGTTLEHPLHRATLAALAWRSEHGSTQHWDAQVAALASAAGGEGLWPLITR
ncbi:acyl-CoA dehydrogenase family protein [Nocardioides sp. Iso805N]|uniref:acyl-CoA dehydrogenase family protein n=1 Tax=Nocardioides sp. Iso805N TaxID=1283287 RepID=UPI0003797226|nr:acyl-CoA dehydrogenase family protein [Nocardioides sp. Iso805N]